MTVTIRLKTSDDALKSDRASELRKIADRVGWLMIHFTPPIREALQDSNGNTVGSVTVTGR